jgi:hypothetical protein
MLQSCGVRREVSGHVAFMVRLAICLLGSTGLSAQIVYNLVLS